MNHRGVSRIRLAMPWLPAALQAAREAGDDVRLPALEWLVARADGLRAAPSHWRQWLIRSAGLSAGLLESCPPGPCLQSLYMGQAGGPPAGTWACARPVHLAAAVDHLRLAPVEDVRLPPADAAELAAHVNTHLAGTGYALEGHALATWSLRCPGGLECTTSDPEEAVGLNVHDFMPSGRDGARIRSLMNELQMLLHEHPVNERRATRGLSPVNCLWLWGFGSAAPMSPVPLPGLATDDEWLAGLWRLQGAAARALDEPLDATQAGRFPALLGHRHAGSSRAGDALRQADAGWLARIRAALRDRQIDGADLLLGETALRIGPSARLRFWRRAPALTEVLR